MAYTDVVSVDEVEVFFASPLVVDLYSDIVKKCTEWPTLSFDQDAGGISGV